jgi:hypothetical protein
MNAFTPRLDILAEAQRGLWPELAQVPAEFTLYGGTAIALQLGHRQSVDFDFFSSQPFDPHELQESIPFLADATVELSKANTLTVFVDRGKRVAVSFFGLPWLRSLRLPWVCADNGLKVASLLDLAATKASAVQGPAEAKDYLDIYALMTLGGIAPTEMLKAAGASTAGLSARSRPSRPFHTSMTGISGRCRHMSSPRSRPRPTKLACRRHRSHPGSARSRRRMR